MIYLAMGENDKAVKDLEPAARSAALRAGLIFLT